MSFLSSWVCGECYRARPLRGLSGHFASCASRSSTCATPSASSRGRVAVARVREVAPTPARRRRAGGRPRRGPRACSRSSARAASRRAPRAPPAARPRRSSRSSAREREVGRPPERAREAPPVAGAPEDVARLGEVALGGVVVARRRSRPGRGRRARARGRAGRSSAVRSSSAASSCSRAASRSPSRRARGRRGGRGRSPARCRRLPPRSVRRSRRAARAPVRGRRARARFRPGSRARS